MKLARGNRRVDRRCLRGRCGTRWRLEVGARATCRPRRSWACGTQSGRDRVEINACGRLVGNDSLIRVLSSSTRAAIFTNAERIVSNVAPRQRDFFGAARAATVVDDRGARQTPWIARNQMVGEVPLF